MATGGLVVNKRMLKQIVIGLVSAGLPVFTTVGAFLEAGDVGGMCMLNTAQATALQSVAQTFNSTCTFNITIGPDGVKQR